MIIHFPFLGLINQNDIHSTFLNLMNQHDTHFNFSDLILSFDNTLEKDLQIFQPGDQFHSYWMCLIFGFDSINP